MKTITLTIAAILTLQAGILFAGNETSSAPVSNGNATISLAPVTPVEATFEDINLLDVDAASLAPSTPMEADFTDVAPGNGIDLTSLAPVPPAEADFE